MFEGPLRYIVVMVLVIIVLRFVLQYAHSKANKQKEQEVDIERPDSYTEVNSIDLEKDTEGEADTNE